jgi:hypothetical protein
MEGRANRSRFKIGHKKGIQQGKEWGGFFGKIKETYI